MLNSISSEFEIMKACISQIESIMVGSYVSLFQVHQLPLDHATLVINLVYPGVIRYDVYPGVIRKYILVDLECLSWCNYNVYHGGFRMSILV